LTTKAINVPVAVWQHKQRVLLFEQVLFAWSRQRIAAAKDDKRLRFAVMVTAGCPGF
tara:strand:+ start:252 stop:422 length:171 start_codon:yes stop_codon:yes gene_type:complete